ncbi:MarR family winged helix-turn-helix transcriptional regulator [Actinacidiphila acididurans]|uniref:MarR family winged helix-turn-helix transcriptional regulator n=1 Tax=Actinacidiphila acididurans TaxID=2784346 RepID=UPI001F46CBBE|nr:MarR family winged helix-turn-helix transcriptional regulator [Actinacidiphila acididurans]
MSRPTPTSENGRTDSSLRTADAVYGLLSSLIFRGSRELSLTSIGTLSTLDRTGPRRITDLAAIAGITQPSVTSLVSGLERAGYVERRGDPADRRVVLVALTPEGSAFLHAHRRARVESFAGLVGQLPEAEAAALAAAVPALEHLRDLGARTRDPGAPLTAAQDPAPEPAA